MTPLEEHIEHLEKDYKSEIEKWEGIKGSLESELTQAEMKIAQVEDNLAKLQEQKKKLGVA